MAANPHNAQAAGSSSPELVKTDIEAGENSANVHSSLTDEQVNRAKATLDALASCDGSLLKCRQTLLDIGVHPDKLPQGGHPTQSLSLEIMEEEKHIQQEAAAEFKIQESDLIGENLDWAADHENLPLHEESMDEYPPPMTGTEPEAQIPEDEPVLPIELEQFFIKNFSMLYTSLKQGIDASIALNMEVKSMLYNLTTEVKMVRDEQIKIGAKLADINAQMEALHKITRDGQFDLQEVRQEISICTAGFSKINSALLQMNVQNIPQGSLPSTANYKFEVNPTVASTKEEVRTTPLSYTREKIIDLMTQMKMPFGKIPIMATMLENRTPRYFAMLLPQINPYITVSVEASRKLIAMTDIKDKGDLQQAFLHLRDLYTKSAPSTPVPVSGPPEPVAGVGQHMLAPSAAPQKAASTRTKGV